MKQKRAAARPPFPIDPPSRIYSAAGAAASALSAFALASARLRIAWSMAILRRANSSQRISNW